MKGYLCSTESEMTVGFQHSVFTDKVTIGGNVKFTDVMQSVINEYFKIDFKKIHGKITAKNKIKFVFKCKLSTVNSAIQRLKEDGIIFKPVKVLERVWW
jgi:hypothetical protein